jgi:hypothetical protein
MYSPSKYYDNSFDVANKGKRILDFNKLNVGQKYLLTIHEQVECGPLIQKDLSSGLQINYYGMSFRIGTAKYDGINMVDQVHLYHLQSHLNLPAMQLCIFEYKLAGNLQEQIKWIKYYKKTINNLCSELNVSEDIERLIGKYF